MSDLNKDVIDLNKIKVGQVVYRSIINECCEGWEAESYCRDIVKSIEETVSGKTITFEKGSNVYLKDGRNEYSYYGQFFKTKKSLLDYISKNVLV